MNSELSSVTMDELCVDEPQTVGALHRAIDKTLTRIFFQVAALQCRPTCCAGSQSSVSSRDSCSSASLRASRPRLTRGEQHTPDPSRASTSTDSSPSTATVTAALAFADRNSGVVFSGLHEASGAPITPNEFLNNKASRLAPTLRLIITPPSPSPATPSTGAGPIVAEKDGEEDNAACPELPKFTLTLASPVSPRSPIHPPSPTTTPFTRTSYYALAAHAPPTARVPYLPQYCSHTLRPFVPLSSCKLCALQLLACETWWHSRNGNSNNSNNKNNKHKERNHGAAATLCPPQVLPATCTSTTRAIFYALGIPLGELDRSCADLDVVESIVLISLPAAQRRVNKKPVVFVRAPSSRMRVLFRRMRHILTAPARVPMIPMPGLAYRRAIARP
ncbi:hypothetical protein BC827DRAFT_1273530 [Russula dissimulans]|nr:hypothetical protein BC827DRAFT_1273530 [Russula dissimulans]